MSKVFLAKITESIDYAVASVVGQTEISENLRGDSVLIKPNLFEPVSYTTGQTTSPYLVEALIKWCYARGAKEVIVGEGPSYFLADHSLKECFIKTGIAEVAERCDAQWILFDEHPFRTYRDISPFLPKQFRISEHAFSHNKIINLPVPKTHYLTKVSIAMKNLKGFLKREDKPLFHRVGINEAVVELNKIITPSLNLVDFTAPVQKHSGFVLAGSDIVAVDTVSASLMGLTPDDINTIQLGHNAGLGEKNLARIDIQGEDIKGLKMRYELPSEWLNKKFPLLKIIGYDAACSGCIIPLFSSLAELENQGNSFKKPLTIVLGSADYTGHSHTVLYIGDCNSPRLKKSSQVEGCPPQKEEILKALFEQTHGNY